LDIKNQSTVVCEDCPVKYNQVIQATGFQCGEFLQCYDWGDSEWNYEGHIGIWKCNS